MENACEKAKFLDAVKLYEKDAICDDSVKKTKCENIGQRVNSSSFSTLSGTEIANEEDSSSVAKQQQQQIKIRKGFLYTIPFFLIANNNFYHDETTTATTNDKTTITDSKSPLALMNSFQQTQCLHNENIKSLKKTHYISFDYENYCNKSDNTNIEYEYEESEFQLPSKRRQRYTVTLTNNKNKKSIEQNLSRRAKLLKRLVQPCSIRVNKLSLNDLMTYNLSKETIAFIEKVKQRKRNSRKHAKKVVNNVNNKKRNINTTQQKVAATTLINVNNGSRVVTPVVSQQMPHKNFILNENRNINNNKFLIAKMSNKALIKTTTTSTVTPTDRTQLKIDLLKDKLKSFKVTAPPSSRVVQTGSVFSNGAALAANPNITILKSFNSNTNGAMSAPTMPRIAFVQSQNQLVRPYLQNLFKSNDSAAKLKLSGEHDIILNCKPLAAATATTTQHQNCQTAADRLRPKVLKNGFIQNCKQNGGDTAPVLNFTREVLVKSSSASIEVIDLTSDESGESTAAANQIDLKEFFKRQVKS